MTSRLRADLLLVRRGLFESRVKAQAAIASGGVTADGARIRKPSDEIAVDAMLVAQPAFPWVSRGGIKLAGALDHCGFAVAGRVCLDVGASTGGFTQVLLARGASRVYAVDVGHGQLHPSLCPHPAIVSMEAQDIRALDPSRLAPAPDFVVIDVSFISLKRVLPCAAALVSRPAQVLALIKPQFEAPPASNKKGIVRDSAVHEAVCDDIAALAAALGCTEIDDLSVADRRCRRQPRVLPRGHVALDVSIKKIKPIVEPVDSFDLGSPRYSSIQALTTRGNAKTPKNSQTRRVGNAPTWAMSLAQRVGVLPTLSGL